MYFQEGMTTFKLWDLTNMDFMFFFLMNFSIHTKYEAFMRLYTPHIGGLSGVAEVCNSGWK